MMQIRAVLLLLIFSGSVFGRAWNAEDKKKREASHSLVRRDETDSETDSNSDNTTPENDNSPAEEEQGKSEGSWLWDGKKKREAINHDIVRRQDTEEPGNTSDMGNDSSSPPNDEQSKGEDIMTPGPTKSIADMKWKKKREAIHSLVRRDEDDPKTDADSDDKTSENDDSSDGGSGGGLLDGLLGGLLGGGGGGGGLLDLLKGLPLVGPILTGLLGLFGL